MAGEETPEQQEDQKEPDVPEAAPTDYRRNVWLLAFMVAVVVTAWLVSVMRNLM